MIFMDNGMGNEVPEATRSSLSLLFTLTALAAGLLGVILATLDHIDGDDGRAHGGDPRLHLVTPPPAT